MSRLIFSTPAMDLKEWVERHIGHKTDDSGTAFWKFIDRARAGWIRGVAGQFKSFFKAEQEAVMDVVLLSASESIMEDAASRVIDGRKAQLADKFKIIYLAVGEHFGELSLSRLKEAHDFLMKEFDMDLVEREILRWLASESSKKVKEISDTAKARIRVEIANGVSEGESIREIAERIDRLYLDQIIPFRSEVIARTEVISASNLGSRAGAKASGLPLNHKWLATRDDRTREDHEQADGQSVPLDEPFIVGGERLMFPGDTSLGASAGNTIQCRCTEIYRRA